VTDLEKTSKGIREKEIQIEEPNSFFVTCAKNRRTAWNGLPK